MAVDTTLVKELRERTGAASLIVKKPWKNAMEM